MNYRFQYVPKIFYLYFAQNQLIKPQLSNLKMNNIYLDVRTIKLFWDIGYLHNLYMIVERFSSAGDIHMGLQLGFVFGRRKKNFEVQFEKVRKEKKL